jgi:predicted metal-dependent phosphoesterase TrpH
MVSAGYARTVQEAFDRWLAEGQPAYVERIGPSPAEVAAVVHAAGGLLSMAHPGRTRMDEEIPAMVASGLDALEVYHSDHDDALVAHYHAMAANLGVLVTGGTDFHAEPAKGLSVGMVTLPPEHWERLRAARERHLPQ